MKAVRYYGRRSYEGYFYPLSTTVAVLLLRHTNLPRLTYPIFNQKAYLKGMHEEFKRQKKVFCSEPS